MRMTVEQLFREHEIYNVRVTKDIGHSFMASYDPDDYLNNIVDDIYGNGYKINTISARNHTIIFFVEEIDNDL